MICIIGVLVVMNLLSVSALSGISVSEASLKLSFGNLRDLRQAPAPIPNRDAEQNRTIVVTVPGDSVQFACPIPLELAGTKVSWIRRRDFQLLSVGEAMYANDNRFFVSHSRHSHYQGSRHSQVWFLHLLNITDGDQGEYECQTSNHPHVSTIIFLKVQSAYSVIMGPRERVVAADTELKLVCSLKNSSKELSYLFWYQGTKMINFDETQGVQVDTARDYSTLTINSIKPFQAGNYTCEPSDAAPSSVIVQVVEGQLNIRHYVPNMDHDHSADEDGSGFSESLGGTNGSNAPSDKASVRQLGVKSASSTGHNSYPHKVLSIVFSLGVCIRGLMVNFL